MTETYVARRLRRWETVCGRPPSTQERAMALVEDVNDLILALYRPAATRLSGRRTSGCGSTRRPPGS